MPRAEHPLSFLGSLKLAELAGLVGGDSNGPEFLNEMLMLQMQAEGWRQQWSVALQENEELRAKLCATFLHPCRPGH